MSKTGGYAQEFLNAIGYDLGYDNNNLPSIQDIEIVWANRVRVWEYKGLTEYEYYGVDENEGKTI